MVSSSMKCVKYLIFIFNLVFWITGLAILGLGAAIHVNYRHYLNFLGDNFLSVPVLMIIVGCIITVIAFFGCCGAIKESYCMMMTFSVLLGLILVVEVGGGIAAFVLRKDLKMTVSEKMQEGLNDFGSNSSVGLTETWNVIQHELQCCGVNNYTDWADSKTWVADKGLDSVPDSCCTAHIDGCGKGQLKDPKDIYKTGCMTIFVSKVDQNVYNLAGVSIGVAVVQLLGVVFACLLASSIKKEYEVV